MSAGSVSGGTIKVSMLLDLSGFQNTLNTANAKVQAFSNRVGAAGKEFIKLGAIIAAPFAEAARVGANFQDKMSGVRAVTQATGEDFTRLTTRAKELGASTSFTASEVGDAMKFMGLAGFKTDQILSGVASTLDLARAGSLDLGAASDIATDLISAFGLEVKDLGTVTDVLAQTQANANTDITQMGEAFKFVAPLSKTMGQSIQETSSLLGVLGNRMLKGSIAGTSLSIVMRKLADNKVAGALKKMGVEVADSEGKMRRVSDVMKDLAFAMKDMGQQAKVAKAIELFDQRGFKAAVALMDGVGKEFDSLYEKNLKATGAARTMARVMDDNLGGAWRRMMSALEGVKIAIADSITGELRNAFGAISKYLSQANDWVQNNKELVISVGKMGVALIAFGGTLVATSFLLSKFAMGVAGIVNVGSGMISGIRAVGAALVYMNGVTITATSLLTGLKNAVYAVQTKMLVSNGTILAMSGAFTGMGGGVAGLTAALGVLKVAFLSALAAAGPLLVALAALATAGYIAKLAMDIANAREETLRLQYATEQHIATMARARAAEGPYDSGKAKADIQEYIANLRALGKTDKQIKEQLLVREAQVTKGIQTQINMRSVYSIAEQKARRVEAEQTRDALIAAYTSDLDAYLLTEDAKREAAKKTAEIQKKLSAERVADLKKQLATIKEAFNAFETSLEKRRNIQTENRDFGEQLRKDPDKAQGFALEQVRTARQTAEDTRGQIAEKRVQVEQDPTEQGVKELQQLEELYKEQEDAIDRWEDHYRDAIEAVAQKRVDEETKADNELEQNLRNKAKEEAKSEKIAKKLKASQDKAAARVEEKAIGGFGKFGDFGKYIKNTSENKNLAANQQTAEGVAKLVAAEKRRPSLKFTSK